MEHIEQVMVWNEPIYDTSPCRGKIKNYEDVPEKIFPRTLHLSSYSSSSLSFHVIENQSKFFLEKVDY